MSVEVRNTRHDCRATTLVELVVALAMMAVVIAAIIPLLSVARITFGTQADLSDALQNGRILMVELVQDLSTAKTITAISEADDTTGYIEFTDNQENTQRFDINPANNYVQHGLIDSLYDLAGPVSQLQFIGYDVCDLDTPITDVNDIRYVKILATVVNANEAGRNLTFQGGTFVFTDGPAATATSDLEGWWCLDDASGTTALDSSGNGRHGTLKNMSGNEWTTGVLDGALEFNGSLDYVELPIGTLIADTTDCTVSAWVKWSGLGDPWQSVFDFGSGTTVYMYLCTNDTQGNVHYGITTSGESNEDEIPTSIPLGTDWHHLAVTIDDVNDTHTLYLDGEIIGQKTSTLNPSDLGETTQNCLGRPQFITEPYLDGILDDVRLYGRALSAQEISDLVSEVPMVIYKGFAEAKTTAAQSLTIPAPGATIAGNLLIAVVVVDENPTLSPPSEGGWTLLSQGTGYDEVTVGVWAKLTSASEPGSHTFTWGNDQEAYGWIMRFRGCDPNNPVDAIASEGGDISWRPPSPSVTTSVTDTMILRIGGLDHTDITTDYTGLADCTTITMDKSSGGKGAVSGGAAYEYQLEIGSSGSKTFIPTRYEEYRTVTIAIAPAR